MSATVLTFSPYYNSPAELTVVSRSSVEQLFPIRIDYIIMPIYPALKKYYDINELGIICDCIQEK